MTETDLSRKKKHSFSDTVHSTLTSLRTPPAPRFSGQGYDALLRTIFFPLSVVIIIHRIFFYPHNPDLFSPPDFFAVWMALRDFVMGQNVYVENYFTESIPYLYSPGATVLLSPFALSPNVEVGKQAIILANALCMIAGLVVLSKIVHVSWKSGLFWAALFFVFISTPVRDTMRMGNINAILFFPLTLFLYFTVAQRTRFHQIWAGVFLALLVIFKPQFLPLAIFFFFRKYWWSLLSVFVTFVGINALGFVLVKDARAYFHWIIPYMSQARPGYNQAIAGLGQWFGFDPTSILILRVLTVVLVGITTVLLFFWVEKDTVFWGLTSAGIILAGVFLASNLGQGYYTLFLFPLFISVAWTGTTIMTNPLIWVAVFMITAPESWVTEMDKYLPAVFHLPGYIHGFGWAIIVVCGTYSVIDRAVKQKPFEGFSFSDFIRS